MINDISHLVIKCGSSSDAHLVSRIWWSTLSNALLKSTSSKRIVVPEESSSDVHLCTSSISACTMDVPLTDRNCWGQLGGRRWRCSKHLDNNGVSDISASGLCE
ncbi:hypothetical protein NP493_661g02033 [Ridgeia piscesae]|uniref:Uncharacterized protein n=1 Tax=Ridgeia piscesae TaxID=27915 RepID=A0AAD9KT65_RIDPI|nr:hypothetical protein NP493_661g02033 [Ridgeia piscesae]